MRPRSDCRIGVVCESQPYSFLRVLRGITSYVQGQAGWQLDKWFANDLDLIGSLRKARPDGLVARIRSPELARQLRLVGCPVVSVYDDLPQSVFPRVMLNQSRVGALGAEYLLGRGFRQLLFVGVDERWSIEREQSFAATVRQARVAKAAAVVQRLTWAQVQREGMTRNVLRRLARPVAIMAANDLIGVHLVEACHSLRLRVPEEVAVLGVDSDETLCEYAATPLSSVDTDAVRLGFEAAALLHRLLRGASSPAAALLVNPRGVVSTTAQLLHNAWSATAV